MTWLLIAAALVAANLPWLTERWFFFFTPKGGVKRAWMRLLEWLAMYFLLGGIALGLESKTSGQLHSQDWEFYAVTFCIFLTFALPGFIYRHDLKHLLSRR